jgi:hypothetical protein
MLNTTVLNHGQIQGGAPTGLTCQLNGKALTPMVESLTAQAELSARGTCRFLLINPAAIPLVGDLVEVRWHSERLFSGLLHEVRQQEDPTLQRHLYDCEAVDWMHTLERRLVTKTYEFTLPDTIVRALMADLLAGEDLLTGTIDTGPLLARVEGTRTRAAEFLRDLATSVGGVVTVDPDRTLHFRRTTFPPGPLTITEAQVQASDTFEVRSEKELYHNRLTITAKGATGGTSVTLTRQSDSEIAARQAQEGGTGIYEAAEEITHPTLTDTASLTRFAVGYALVRLTTATQTPRTVQFTTREPHVKVAQQMTISVPSYGLAGTWLVTRVEFYDEFGRRPRYLVEALETTTENQELQTFLGLVNAGRAAVTLPIQLYQNTQLYDTAGTFSFTVPGTGTVEVELTVLAPGAGGAGSTVIQPFGPPCEVVWNSPAATGGKGGNGGKAIVWKQYPAGTVLTVTIQAAGVGGALGFSNPPTCPAPGDGTDAGFVKVERGGDLQVRAFGGTKGVAGAWAQDQPIAGAAGGDGAGEGDLATTGGGGAGGAGGPGTGGAAAGQNGTGGRVEIRY